MSESSCTAPQEVPSEVAKHIDQVCDGFEAAWLAGERPRIEDRLTGRTEPMRSALLHELLLVELSYRWGNAEQPAPEEYEQRFPADRDLVRAIFQEEALQLHRTPSNERTPGLSGVGASASGLVVLGEQADAVPLAGTLPAETPPGPNLAPGSVLGDYELLNHLGSGGMGVVYRARQRSTKRFVALKVIRPDRIADLPPPKRQECIRRFRTEAQAAARLDHENVVPVYDVGESDGYHFYSMRYVPGPSLADVLRKGPLSGRRAAEYLEQVARAVHHAHTSGILHRDLKPGNILLDARDRPCVADFGLAKWLEGTDTRMTQSGAVLGSPPYMAPEQVFDSAHAVAPSDVYSLGATLYELLTGRPPFQGTTPWETFCQVINEDPVPPRQHNPAIDRDLETIALKCLRKDPAERYPSAAALAEDLRRHLDGVPIQARPTTGVERLWRWCRRNPLVAGLTTAVVLLSLVAVGALALAYRPGGPSEPQPRELVGRLMDQAEALKPSLRAGRRGQALGLLEQAAELLPADDAETRLRVRNEYLRWLDVPDLQPIRSLTASPEALANLGPLGTVGATDKRLPHSPHCLLGGVASGATPLQFRTLTARGPVEWGFAEGAARGTFAGMGPHAAPTILSPDGRFCAASKPERREVEIWDLDKRQSLGVVRDAEGNPFRPHCLAFSGSPHRLATAHEAREGRPPTGRRYLVGVYDVPSLQLIGSWSLDVLSLDCLCFHPEQTWLAASVCRANPSDYHVIRLWDLANAADAGELLLDPSTAGNRDHLAPHRLAFTTDGRFLAAVKDALKVWELEKGKSPREVLARPLALAPADAVYSLGDARFYLTVDRTEQMQLWDVSAGRIVAETRLDEPFPTEPTSPALPAGADARLVVAPRGTGASPGLGVWSFAPPASRLVGPPPQTLKMSATPANFSLTFSPDDRWLAYGVANDFSPYLLDLKATHAPPVALNGGPGGRVLAFSPQSDRLWGASPFAQQSRLWELPSLKARAEESHRFVTAGFQAGGQRLAVLRKEVLDLAMVDLESGRERRLASVEQKDWKQTAPPLFSPDGRQLLVGMPRRDEGTPRLQLWDVAKGEQQLERTAGTARFFFQGGRALALDSPETLAIKDLVTNQVLPTTLLKPPPPFVNNDHSERFFFAPGGEFCAETGLNGEIACWRLEGSKWTLQTQIRRASERTSSRTTQDLKSFSPDATRLAAFDGPDLLKVWDTRTGEERGRLELPTRPEWFGFAADGKGLLLVWLGREVRLWQPRAPQSEQVCSLETAPELEQERKAGWWSALVLRIADAVCLSKDQRRLVYVTPADAAGRAAVHLWELPSGKLTTRRIPLRCTQAPRIALDPSGEQLAVQSVSGILEVRDLDAGVSYLNLPTRAVDVDHPLPTFVNQGKRHALSADCGHLAYVAEAGSMRQVAVFDVKARAELSRFPLAETPACLALTGGARILAVAQRRQVQLVDPSSGELLRTLEAHEQPVTDLAFAGRTPLLVTASAGERTIRLWDPTTGEDLATLATGEEALIRLALSPSGRWLAVLDARGRLRLWNLSELRQRLRAVGLDWTTTDH